VEEAAAACGVEAVPVADDTTSSTSVAAGSASRAASISTSPTETGAEAPETQAVVRDVEPSSASPSATSESDVSMPFPLWPFVETRADRWRGWRLQRPSRQKVRV